MVRITEIKMTKKGRYALFCDEKFLFSVDEDTFLDWSIHRDMELSEQQLRELREKTDIRKAKQKAFDLLSNRAHSKKELIEKLEKRYDRYTADAAVDEVEALGYLDDLSFAKNCMEYIFLRKNMSRRAAVQYLQERGISKEIVDVVLEDYEESDLNRIEELIERKYQRKLQAENGYHNVFSALARRGFSASDIRRTLAKFIDAEYYEDE